MDRHVIPLLLGRANLERLGVPDGLSLDLSQVKIDQSIRIQRSLGLAPLEFLRQVMSGMDAQALKAAVWLALTQAGINLDLDEVSFHTYPTDQAAPNNGPEDDEGKAPE